MSSLACFLARLHPPAHCRRSLDSLHSTARTTDTSPTMRATLVCSLAWLTRARELNSVAVASISAMAYRDLGIFLLTGIGWTLTSLGKPTQSICPAFSPVNSNLQWSLSPSGSFQSKEIDLPETLMFLMWTLLERVGSVTTSTVPVVSVFTLQLHTCMPPKSSPFSERRCKTIIGVPAWTAVHVPMSCRISDSGGFIWASVGPARGPVTTNAVRINTVRLTIRQNNLIPI